MTPTWKSCGHPNTPENTKAASPSTGPRCRICHTARLKRWRLANTTGQPKGRPRSNAEIEPIGLTDEDLAFRDMVRIGTNALGAAIDRMIGRTA